MGYTISTLKGLASYFEYYFFLIGDYSIDDRISAFFEADFDKIATEIGNSSAIIKAANREQYEKELIRSLSNVNSKIIRRLIQDFEYCNPGLLILDAHPNDIIEETLVLFIPVRNLGKLYGSNIEFYRDLINLSKKRDAHLIKKIEQMENPWRKMLDKLQLKPNFYNRSKVVYNYLQKTT